MGSSAFGMSVERRDVLKRYTSAAYAEGSSGKPRLPRLLRQRVHWKNLSYVPAEVPERAAN